jgi:hypothetical protein
MSAPMIDIYVDDPMRFTALGTYARKTPEQLDWSRIVAELQCTGSNGRPAVREQPRRATALLRILPLNINGNE